MSDVIERTEPIMNRKQAAALLGVAEVTLRRWARDGKGPRLVKFGTADNAAVRYPRAWIVEWLATQEIARCE